MNIDITCPTNEERRTFWSQKISEWQSLGCSRKEFCQFNSLKYSTFNYWYKKLLSSSKNQPANFLEITDACPTHENSSLAAEIELGELRIKIYPDSDPAIVEAIIRGMK